MDMNILGITGIMPYLSLVSRRLLFIKHDVDVALKKVRLDLRLLPKLSMIDRQFLDFNRLFQTTILAEIRDGNLKSVMTKERIWNW